MGTTSSGNAGTSRPRYLRITVPSAADDRPTIALVMGGNDPVDDWLDSVGISLEVAINDLDVGFAFGYAAALKRAGIRTVFVAYSRHVRSPTRAQRDPCGTVFRVFPLPQRHALVGRRYDSPDYSKSKPLSLNRLAGSVRWHLGSYLAADFGSLASTIREERCMGVICHDYETPQFDITTVIARRYDLAVFGMFQGGGQLSRFETPVRRLTINACAGLIIPARSELERVRSRYRISSQKLAYIPNPVDVRRWQEGDRRTARARLGLPLTSLVVAYHGRIELHDKGLEVLLSAWQSLCRARPEQDLRLLLVGSGGDADQLAEALRSGRLRGVHWTNRYIVRCDELRQYLRAADVYAFASRYEGSPLSLIEAMASGLPIVATSPTGVSDLLGDGDDARGLTVEIDDARAFARAIGRLLDNPELRNELGSRASDWATKHHDVAVVGEQLRRFMARRGLRVNQPS